MPYMIANVDGIRFILLARETSANYIISQIKTRATGLSGLSRIMRGLPKFRVFKANLKWQLLVFNLVLKIALRQTLGTQRLPLVQSTLILTDTPIRQTPIVAPWFSVLLQVDFL